MRLPNWEASFNFSNLFLNYFRLYSAKKYNQRGANTNENANYIALAKFANLDKHFFI